VTVKPTSDDVITYKPTREYR